jgi:hypothetical protein
MFLLLFEKQILGPVEAAAILAVPGTFSKLAERAIGYGRLATGDWLEGDSSSPGRSRLPLAPQHRRPPQKQAIHAVPQFSRLPK